MSRQLRLTRAVAAMLILAVAMQAALSPASAQGPLVTEWNLPAGNSQPTGIAVDQIGKVWFTETSANKLAKLDPNTGTISEWDLPTGGAMPLYLSLLPVSGGLRVAFSEYGSNRVGYLDNYTGYFYEWTLPTGNSRPAGIQIDERGTLWFAESGRNVIGSLSPTTGLLTEWTLPSSSGPLTPWGIYVKQAQSYSSGVPTHFVWFTERTGSKIGMLDPSNDWLITYDLSSLPGGSVPIDLTVDSNNNIVFTDIGSAGNRIGVLNYLSSTVAVLTAPTSQAQPIGVQWDSGRKIAWFAESNAGRVASVNSAGAVFMLVSEAACTIAGIPASFPQPCTGGAGLSTTMLSLTSTFRAANFNVENPTSYGAVTLTSGQFIEYALPTTSSFPIDVAVSADGAIWFTENSAAGNRIGRLTLPNPMVFNLSVAQGTRSVTQGQSTTFVLSATLTGGLAEPVQFSLAAAPAGLTAAFTPTSGTPSLTSLLTVGTTFSTPVGTYILTALASSPTLTRSVAVTLVVGQQPPAPFDFAIATIGQNSASVTQGDAATYAFSITQTLGTAAATTLTVSGVPPSAQATMISIAGTPPFTSTLNVQTTVGTSAGSYQMTVTAISGGKLHAATVTLNVAALPRGLHLTASSNSVAIVQASAQAVGLTVQATGAFSGPVSFTAAVNPSGLEVDIEPNGLNLPVGGSGTATVKITAPKAATSGSYTVVVSATGNGVSESATISVSVSGCLIATATYGSPSAPEVQFLRDFRDKQILKTFAGSNFMVAFNAWYYSFSPQVAGEVSANAALREVARAGLYPLLEILRLSSAAYSAVPFSSEIGALAAGLTSGLLIGAVFLAPPLAGALLLTRRRTGRKTVAAVAKCFAAAVAGAVLAFAVAELLLNPALIMTAGTILVLLAVSAGGVLPAVALVRRT